jgi:hypothetical protein
MPQTSKSSKTKCTRNTACHSFHPQVTLGIEEYGRYTSRLYKGITKAFFPRTYEALKAVQEIQDDYGDAAEAQQDGEHCCCSMA